MASSSADRSCLKRCFPLSDAADIDAAGEALLEEARLFEKNLLNFFWRHGVSHFDGEDLVQETYLRLWRHRADYERSAKLSTFLFMIARQVWIDALRRQSRREGRETRWAGERDQTETPRLCVREDVRWAVSRLPEQMREVVELAVFQDMPYAEVAEILAIPMGTVKSRMFNALRRLKEAFDDEGP